MFGHFPTCMEVQRGLICFKPWKIQCRGNSEKSKAQSLIYVFVFYVANFPIKPKFLTP